MTAADMPLPKFWRGPNGASMPAEIYIPWSATYPADAEGWEPLYDGAVLKEYAAARVAEVAGQMAEALRYFAAYAAGENQGHLYEGDCPDQSQPDSRDPACPACKAMEKARAALLAYKESTK